MNYFAQEYMVSIEIKFKNDFIEWFSGLYFTITIINNMK